MANSIGRASLILNATYGKVTSGLDAAYGKISSFKNKVAGLFGGGFAGSLLGKLGSDAMATTDALTNAGKQAAGIGAGTAEFMALDKAIEKVTGRAGRAGEVLGGVSALVGKAGFGDAKAVKALSALNLSFGQLEALRPDEQFRAIADAVKELDNDSLMAGAAAKAFGGTELLPILKQGAAGFDAMVQKSRDLGTALDDVAMGKLMRLRDAVPKVKQVFEGAWNKIVVALSPILAGVAERLSDLADRARPVVDLLVRGFDSFAKIADAALAEVWAAVDGVAAGIGRWLGGLAGGVDWFREVDSMVKTILLTAAAVGLQMYHWGKAAAAAAAAVVGQFLTSLQRAKASLAGMFIAAAQLPGSRLIKDQLTSAYKQLQKMDLNPAGDALADWAAQIRDGIGGANDQLAQMAAWMDEVLKRKGLAERPLPRGLRDLVAEDGGGRGDSPLSAALLKGSTAEYSARVRFETGAVADAQKQMVKEQQKTNELLKEMKTVHPGLDDATVNRAAVYLKSM